MDDYRKPTFVFHCTKCGKPFFITGLDDAEIRRRMINAAFTNVRLSIYYGNKNPLIDGCNCMEEKQ